MTAEVTLSRAFLIQRRDEHAEPFHFPGLDAGGGRKAIDAIRPLLRLGDCGDLDSVNAAGRDPEVIHRPRRRGLGGMHQVSRLHHRRRVHSFKLELAPGQARRQVADDLDGVQLDWKVDVILHRDLAIVRFKVAHEWRCGRVGGGGCRETHIGYQCIGFICGCQRQWNFGLSGLVLTFAFRTNGGLLVLLICGLHVKLGS
jgi:hypothetical protein